MKKILSLVFGFVLYATVGFAQITVTPTTTFTFAASPDHSLQSGGQNLVTSYLARVQPSGSSTVVFSRSLGKPTPNGSNNISTSIGWTAAELGAIPGGNYVLIVATIGPGGTTDNIPSDVFIIPTSLVHTNVAASAAGAIALASTTYNSTFLPDTTINGDRKGVTYWNDGTSDTWPDWLEVDFNGSKTINEVDVFTVQDNFQSPIEPTAAMTFSLYGIKNFDVQYWNGSAWVTLASATNNTLVWRQFTFTPVTTTKIRIFVTNGLNSWSRITEVEAWIN